MAVIFMASYTTPWDTIRTAFSGDDVIGGLTPDKGPRLCVVQQEVVVDRALEIVDAGVTAPSDALHGDLGEWPAP